MSDEPNAKFSGLTFLIQYRRKDDGIRWHNMAAFEDSLEEYEERRRERIARANEY